MIVSGRGWAAIRVLIVPAILCSARPAFADGALHYDTGRVVVVLGCLALAVLASILVIAWLVRAILRRGTTPARPRRWPAEPPAELPVARTVVDSRRED